MQCNVSLITMSSFLRYVLITLCFAIVAGREFRFDYDYYPDIDGWLKLHSIPSSWRDAFRRCDLEGAVLASPTDTNMITAMSIHMNTKNKKNCVIYTGVHATFSKGDFFSIEGLPLIRMPVRWAEREPGSVDNNEDCILLLEDGTIADINCSESFPFMCYKKKTKDMVMTSCGTVDKDYELSPATKNCYKFHPVGKPWQQAFRTCSAEGGYLAIINSPEEAEFLKQFYEKNHNKITNSDYKDSLMLGFHDWGEHGVWRTIHGLKLDDAGYNKWDDGQPNNSTGSQFCGSMSPNFKLNDFWCDGYTAPFVCEKSPDSLLDVIYTRK